jgi:transcriptional regulator with XRE-family HTH domain
MTRMTPRERMFYTALGNRIRKAREANGMSQPQLGRRIGVTGVAVHYWETAKHRPQVFTLREIERVLGRELAA